MTQFVSKCKKGDYKYVKRLIKGDLSRAIVSQSDFSVSRELSSFTVVMENIPLKFVPLADGKEAVAVFIMKDEYPFDGHFSHADSINARVYDEIKVYSTSLAISANIEIRELSMRVIVLKALGCFKEMQLPFDGYFGII